MQTEAAGRDTASPPDEPASRSASDWLAQPPARLLAGFGPAFEAAFRREHLEATRFLRMAGLGFALIAYPSFLLLDLLWSQALQYSWVYGLCFGLAWPASLLAWLSAHRHWRAPFDQYPMLIGAIAVNSLVLCIGSAIGLRSGVEIPFEAFLQLIVYIYVLGGLGFRTSAALGGLTLVGYGLAAGLAGIAGDLLVKRLYFLGSLWIMSGVGAALVEISARRAWLGRQVLADTRQRLQEFLDHAPSLSWIKNERGEYLFASQSFRAFLGVGERALEGRTDFDFFPADFARQCREAEQQVLHTGIASEMIGPSPPDAGTGGPGREWMLVRFAIDDSASRRCIGGVATEVTERRRLERALIDSERRVRALMDKSPALVWMKGEDLRYTYLSQNYQRLLKVEGRDWTGLSDLDFWPAELVEEFHRSDIEVLSSGRTLETVETTPNEDGGLTYWRVLKFPYTDAEGRRYVGGIGFDVSRQRQAEDELRFRSLTDELTGLYNRRGLVSLAEQQLRLSKRGGGDSALLFVDVNGLKGINDGHGHSEGDRAIAAIGEAIRVAGRDSDIAGRIGGDEFVVFAPGCLDPAQLRDRILRQIEQAQQHEARPYRLSASIGYVVVPADSTQSFEELLAIADAEMYAIKKQRAEPRAG